MKRFSVLLLLSVVVFVGCGKDTQQIIVNPEYTPFAQLKEVKDGPAWVQERAKAVVKIVDWSGQGTGFFVSNSGLLATNYHVLGGDSCFQQGCSVSISFGYQFGTKYTKPQNYWAEPVSLNPGDDIAFWQLYKSRSDKAKISVDSYIDLSKASKIGINEELVCIGHPLGSPKKVMRGTVVANTGVHINSQITSIGGASGSPCFNSNGQVVSINHSGTSHEKNMARVGFLDFSGSSSLEQYRQIDVSSSSSGMVKNLDSLKSINSIESDEVLENEALFRNYGGVPARLSGGSKYTFFNLHKEKCVNLIDIGHKVIEPYRLSGKLWTHCFSLEKMISCSSDKDNEFYKNKSYYSKSAFSQLKPFVKICPSASLKSEIRTLFEKALDLIDKTRIEMTPYLWSLARLEYNYSENSDEGYQNAYDAISLWLEKTGVDISGDVAWLLSYYAQSDSQLEYQSVPLKDYVLSGYMGAVGYEKRYRAIVESGYELYRYRKAISHSEFNDLVEKALSSDYVSFGDFVKIQILIYNHNGI